MLIFNLICLDFPLQQILVDKSPLTTEIQSERQGTYCSPTNAYMLAPPLPQVDLSPSPTWATIVCLVLPIGGLCEAVGPDGRFPNPAATFCRCRDEKPNSTVSMHSHRHFTTSCLTSTSFTFTSVPSIPPLVSTTVKSQAQIEQTTTAVRIKHGWLSSISIFYPFMLKRLFLWKIFF